MSVLNPLSSVKTAWMPPPRSSAPRRPQREGSVPVTDGMRTRPLPLPLAWLTYSMPVSTSPYSVTL